MKIRSTVTCAVVAFALAASACGPAEKSADSSTSRTKNAALPASCATGGDCKVGDVGPGGGTVFFDAGANQAWGRYLEAAPKNVASDQLWCSSYRDIPGAGATEIGAGKQNTIDIDAACNSGAGQVAADYVFGGKDDWYLPSKDELNVMFKQKQLLGLSGEFLFSSSEAGYWTAWDIYMGDGTLYPQGKNNGRIVRPIRAFAAAAPAPTTTATPAPTTVAPTTSTVAPTTATTAPATTTSVLATTTTSTTAGAVKPAALGNLVQGAACADGGACKLGDRGPGGGIIFYDAGSNMWWGRYLEGAPQRENRVRVWCSQRTGTAGNDIAIGNGYFNTYTNAPKCSADSALKVAADYKTATRDDWFLPSFDEMATLAKFASTSSLFDLGGLDYWTSSVYDDGMAITSTTYFQYPGKQRFDNMTGGANLSYLVRLVVAGETTTRSAPAPVKPVVATTTSSTIATTTTLPKPTTTIPACSAGGPCKVGDTGPGGGVIFHDSGTDNSWGRYLEVAPSILNQVKVWCTVRTVDKVNGSAVGDGYFNTATRATQCGPDTGLRYAWDYTTSTRDDWFMPSLEEMRILAKAGRVVGTEFWTSTRYDDGGVNTIDARYSYRGSTGLDHITAGGRATAPIRYVRSGESSAKTATPPTTTTTSTSTTSTTTTIPKPTTTTLPCASGGACKPGDVGPGGGIVFYDAGKVQPWGRFLEAAPRDYNTVSSYDKVARTTGTDWCNGWGNMAGTTGDGIGAGKANTAAMAKACTTGAGKFADDYVNGKSTDWYLPSKAELNELLKRKDIFGDANSKVTGFTSYSGACYWSSTQLNDKYAVFNAWMQWPDLTQWSYVKSQSCFARFIRSF